MKPTRLLQSFLIAASSSLLAISSASAGQTWDGGGANNNWSTAANWDSDTSPNLASPLVFAGTAVTFSSNNDLAVGTTIAGFTFSNGSVASQHTITGNQITLGGNISVTGQPGSSPFMTDSFGLAMILNGTRTFDMPQRHGITFTGVISETGGSRGLNKTGTGIMVLSAANTFSGTMSFSAGVLNLNNSLALQNAVLDTTVTPTASGTVGLRTQFATLTFGGLSGSKNLASVFATSGGLLYSGVTALTLNPGTGATPSYSGVIANGTSLMTLTKTGIGTQTLSNSNTYTGATTITAGKLSVASMANGGTASGIGQSTNAATNLIFNGGTLAYTGASQVTDRAFTINADKTATIDVTNGLTLVGHTGTATNGALAKSGAGTLTLSGVNTYTGATNVDTGTLIVNGNISTSATTVASTATLGGNGTVGALSVLDGGNLAPGTSPGTLTVNGALTLGLSNLNFELNPGDFTVGGGLNDLVSVTGNFTLDGTLNLTPTSGDFLAATSGDAWRLFNYTGSLTDNSLAFGTMPTLGSGLSWNIDTATTGQVNLVVIPEPSTALLGGLGLLVLLRRRRA